MKQRIQAAVLRMAAVLGIGATVLLTGCSKDFFSAVNNNPVPTGSTYVYVTNSSGTGGTLNAYSFASGALTALSGSPFTLAAIPTSVVVAPNNKFLFVGTSTGVFLYTINSDGTLTEGNGSTVVYIGQTTSTVVQSMAVDSTSSWLIVANQNTGQVDALSLDPTTGIPSSSTVATAILKYATPQQVSISPGNKNVFVALAGNGTAALTFDASSGTPWGKTATYLPVAKANGSDNAVTVDSTSTYVFVAEANTNQLRSIPIATFGSSGETDVTTGQGPAAVLADLSGDFVYVANATDNTIGAYSLSAGTLTALTDSPFSSAKSPLAMAEDSTKGYLLTIGSKGNPNLWVYNFDATTAGDLDVKTTTSTASASTSAANGIAVTH